MLRASEVVVYLFGWLEKIAGLGDVFMGNLIDKDQDGFGGLVGFLADHLGHAFADVLFLFFAEGSGNPDAYVWHDSSLIYVRCCILIIKSVL